jgi:hypothetical protein
MLPAVRQAIQKGIRPVYGGKDRAVADPAGSVLAPEAIIPIR